MKADSYKRTSVLAVTVLAVTIVVLVFASAALAFDGARDGYQDAAFCAGCHDTGGSGPTVYPEWQMTGHASLGVEGGVPVGANAEPIMDGPRCAGCHSSNYDPTKAQGFWVTPSPSASPVIEFPHENTAGDDAFSEPFIGCSACHYDRTTAHDSTGYGNLANAEICGQCHDRYSANKTAFTVPAVSPSPATTVTPEYPVNFNPYTTALDTVHNVPQPDPSATAPYNSAVGSQTFWKNGEAAKAHGGGAVQFQEWQQYSAANDPVSGRPVLRHVNSLRSLKALSLPDAAAEGCLECHSADYRIAQEAGKTTPALSTAKYGDTCVTCHTPHGSETTSVWDPSRNTSLTKPAKELCVECHNAEIPANTTIKPGAQVHHPMKEMMAGYGAIGVARQPSVHQGKCVECHMVPTGWGRSGAATAGNHTFQIVYPDEAAGQTATISGTARNMPYSSCSKCHGTQNDPLATWIDDTIDQRQEFMRSMVDAVTVELTYDAAQLGFKKVDGTGDVAAARTALTAKDIADLSPAQLDFLKAITNRDFITSEGSWGIHNWQYAVATINKAMDLAQWPYKVTLKSSKARISAGKTVKLSGAVVPVDFTATDYVVKIKRKSGTSWKLVKTATVAVPGGTYTVSFKVPKGTSVLKATFFPPTERSGGVSKLVKVVGS